VEWDIKKFGKLLQIAFGEAGAEIIGMSKIAILSKVSFIDILHSEFSSELTFE